MDSDLAQEAVQAALSQNWEKAILLNTEIIKQKEDDIEALNRLARAFAETGERDRARKTSEKVLKLDSTNLIATRCLTKWKSFKANGNGNGNSKVTAGAFIEEPGKTKVIGLLDLGDKSNITGLTCGDLLKLIPHPHRLSVTTLDGKYIGRFSDDLAFKFIQLIKSGANCEAFVKSVDKAQIKVLVRWQAKNGL